MHERIFSDPPAIIGHRGFGKSAEGRPRENTAESYRVAADVGVDWIELDVRRTADDALTVLHDPAWEDGTLVVERTAKQLGDEYGILTLDDALEAIPTTVGVDIEIKQSAEDALVKIDQAAAGLLCPVLEREHTRRPLLVSSFDPVSVTFVRDRVPGVPLGYITWLSYPFDMGMATAKHLDVQVLMAHWRTYTPPGLPGRRLPADVVDIAHKAGLELAAWSPAPEQLPELVAVGVDAITVDDIPGAFATLRGEV